jgi:hypothetical protein
MKKTDTISVAYKISIGLYETLRLESYKRHITMTALVSEALEDFFRKPLTPQEPHGINKPHTGANPDEI